MNKCNAVIIFIKCLACLAFFFTGEAQAINYYFSTSTGNDGHTGLEAQHASTPWKSLEKLQLIMPALKAGDSVLFKCGDTFTGSINITQSGAPGKPIVFGSFGTGSRPVISGLLEARSWQNMGKGLWQFVAPAAVKDVRLLLWNGRPVPMGRFPNTASSGKKYFTIDNVVNTDIISSALKNGQPDWTGAEIVIRKDRWILDKETVAGQAENRISYGGGRTAAAKKGYGFFLQNNRSALDEDGEWYFDKKMNTLGVFLSHSDPGEQRIEVASVATIVSIYRENYISLSNLIFKGAASSELDIASAKWISVHHCDFVFSANTAVLAASSDHLEFTDCFFNYTNNIAFDGSNHISYLTFLHNVILNTGIFPGMGGNGSGSYEAVILNGNNNLLAGNRIDTTGYIPISFRGDSVTVKNNSINYFGFVKDDCGGIYTWNNEKQARDHAGGRITGNIVRGATGAAEGTDNSERLPAHGIYIDDNSANIEITGNTVAGCAQYGIFIHNSRSINITGNTLYDNTAQLAMIHDNIGPVSPVIRNRVVSNILFAKDAGQLAAVYKTISSDISELGYFENNVYGRAVDNELIIEVGYTGKPGGVSPLTLLQWKKISGRDGRSGTSQYSYPPYSIAEYTSNNLIGNGQFSSSIDGISVYSPEKNMTVRWRKELKPDDSYLQVYFDSTTANAKKSSVIVKAGPVTAGKNYLVSFSEVGPGRRFPVEIYLRQRRAPYKNLTDRKLLPLDVNRKGPGFLFLPTLSEPDACLVFDIAGQAGQFGFDNLSLRQANVRLRTGDQSLRLEYNDTGVAKRVDLHSSYTNILNTPYPRLIILQPYTSLILCHKLN